MWPASHRQCRSTRCASCLASEWCGARHRAAVDRQARARPLLDKAAAAVVSVVNAAGSGFVVGLDSSGAQPSTAQQEVHSTRE